MFPSEEKQTKNQKKNSTQISPYTKLTQTTGPNLGEQKQKEEKNSTLKPGNKEISNTISLKTMKRQRNTTQMKEKKLETQKSK